MTDNQQGQTFGPAADLAPNGQNPQAIMLTGYLGESGADGRTRLYLDESARAYAEFDPSDVVSTQQIPGAPLGGGVAVYLSPNASVTHVQTQSGSIGSFMQGALAKSAVAQAAQAGGLSSGSTEAMVPAASFLFISCGGGGGVTNYDSIFWCQSRFMCNPQSLSCLC